MQSYTIGQAARLLFGLAIVLVILFEPAGLVGFANRFKRKGRKSPARTTGPTPSPTPAQGSTT